MTSRAERFWAKVDKTGDCWLWMGSKKPYGYGTFWLGEGERRLIVAHRWSWSQVHGDVAPGLELDHLCKNTSCVRPDHLEAVTPFVNNVLRSNSAAARNYRKTHCDSGHKFTPENTYVRREDGGRICRTCRREYVRRSRSRAA